LIRFVVAPDGAVVPDLARRLPGRGAWVQANRAALERAIKSGALAKSFKRQAHVPADLVARVEDLLTRRLREALSLANKAGLVVAGFAKVEEALRSRRVAVLVHASDAGPSGVAKLDALWAALMGEEAAGAARISELSGAELSLAMGRSNVVHAAASAGGASAQLLAEAARLKRFRTGTA
jgi:predicted RNA-binding protein YlxR (DUF448 family)